MPPLAELDGAGGGEHARCNAGWRDPRQHQRGRETPEDDVERAAERVVDPGRVGSAVAELQVEAERHEDGKGKEQSGGAAHQNVSRVCNSSRRLFALSEKTPLPEPAGWLARPNSGEAMLPMIAPGLLWFVTLRICIETVRLKRRSLDAPPPCAAPATPNGLAGALR